MREKKIEFEKVIVKVQYNRIVTKDDVEESCVRFLKSAMRSKEKSFDPNINKTRAVSKK